MSNPSAYHVLLSRLTHAMAAGCILAGASGCDGAAQDDTSSSRSANLGTDEDNGVDTDGADTDDSDTDVSVGTEDGAEDNPGLKLKEDTDSPEVDDGTEEPVEGPAEPEASTEPAEPEPSETSTEPGTSTPDTETPNLMLEDPTQEPEATPEEADGGMSVQEPSDAGVLIEEPEPLTCEFGQLQDFCMDMDMMVQQARYGVGQIPLDPPRTDEEVEAGFDENGCMKPEWVATSCCNPALAAGEPQENGQCCYVACEGACCGRPLVSGGQAIVAQLSKSPSWCQPGERLLADASETERQALAEEWLLDGLMEHASVASFSCFTLDLMALGAPPELLAAAQQAGLDEVKHAEGCFSIASRLHPSNTGPGPLELKTWTVRDAVSAVQAAVHEGCVGEVLAAGIAKEQASRCTNPEIRKHLDVIVRDETRHAELAWRFVAWAIERFGEPVRRAAKQAFSAALENIPKPPSKTTHGVSSEVLHAAGRVTRQEWQNAAESVFELVLKPAAKELLERDQAAPGLTEHTAC